MTDTNGEKVAAVIPIECEALLEDLRSCSGGERRNEPRVSLDQVEQRLKADGLFYALRGRLRTAETSAIHNAQRRNL